MAYTDSYTETADLTPPKNVELECLLSDNKSVTKLIFDGNLYWRPDYSMYVYFIPKFWRAK